MAAGLAFELGLEGMRSERTDGGKGSERGIGCASGRGLPVNPSWVEWIVASDTVPPT